jgi:predicted transposase/invertase (TIGR01784 family)
MTKLKHTLKEDILCKMVFVKHPHLLQRFVAWLLGIPFESIKDFVITNPEMPPESLGDKFCRFDINMLVNGQQVDLEVQVNPEKGYVERSVYYWARAFSNALTEGEDYSILPRTITISIVNFDMFICEKFHSKFGILELTRYEELTDRFRMHFFELPKLPKIETISKDDKLHLWLSLFRAETEEELAKIEALGVDEMEQAIQAYRHTAVSPEFKEIERLRSKARHDEAQALNNERYKEKIEIATTLLGLGDSIEKIATATGLSHEEIEKLQ